MKYFLLLLNTIIFQQHAAAQEYVNEFYDTLFVKHHHLLSFKEFRQDQGKKKELFYAITFNRHGVIDTYSDIYEKEDEVLVRGFASHSYNEDSTDASGKIIQRKHFSDNQLIYTEQYTYSDNGQHAFSHYIEKDSPPLISMAASYDERGNLIELFRPGVGSRNENRWVKSYNKNDQLVLVKAYTDYIILHSIDSTTYDNNGNKTGNYNIDKRDGKFIITAKYTAGYDSYGNKIADSTWETYSGKLHLRYNRSYSYNSNNQLIKKEYYDQEDNFVHLTSKTTIEYNKQGLRTVKKEYDMAQDDANYSKLKLKRTTTYQYTYY